MSIQNTTHKLLTGDNKKKKNALLIQNVTKKMLQDCTIALKIIPYKCTFVAQRYHIYLVDKNKFCDVKSNLN